MCVEYESNMYVSRTRIRSIEILACITVNTSTIELNFNILFNTIRLVYKVVAKLMVKSCFTTCTGVDPGFSDRVMRAWPQSTEAFATHVLTL